MSKRNESFPVEEIRRLLRYDPETGEIFRVSNATRVDRVGKRAGSITELGYRRIKIKCRAFYAGNIAWVLMTGNWPPPEMEVDHEDRNRSNDRWKNLRLATRVQQCLNRGLMAHNRSGYSGISERRPGVFNARIYVKRVTKYLGQFPSLELAIAARNEAAAAAYGDFIPIKSASIASPTSAPIQSSPDDTRVP